MTDSQPLLPLNPLISVCFASCLSWIVVSQLETIVIIYLFYLAITSPRKCCLSALQKGNKGLGLPPHLPGLEGPVGVVEKVPGTREVELNGCAGSTRACRNMELRSST